MSDDSFIAWEKTCRIQRVLQQDPSGCGVACLAMVANVSYLTARGVFEAIGTHLRRPDNPYSTNFKQLRQALSEMEIGHSMERWRGWEGFCGVGILSINPKPGHDKGNWHWVVAEDHPVYGVVVHDPSPSHAILKLAPDDFICEDFGERCQPRKSWIRIHLS